MSRGLTLPAVARNGPQPPGRLPAPADAPPQTLAAERSVLAACLLNADAIAKARALLTPTDFYLNAHARLFAAILALADRSEAVDSLTLASELARRDDLAVCGGAAGIARISDMAGTSANVAEHAHLVLETARRRQLRRLGLDLQARVSDPTQSAADILGHLDREAGVLAASCDGATGAAPHVGLDLDLELEPLPVLLDRWLIEGDLGLFCGTTGDGKTTTQAAIALALSSGEAPWKGGPVPRRIGPVIYLDAEMGRHATRRTFKRLMAGMGLDRRPEPLLVVSAPGEVSLVSPEGLLRIEATLLDWSRRHEALGPPVIFFDTLSAVLAGLESFNDAALVEPVYRALFGWRDRLGATIVLSHHPRKRGRWETGAPTLDQVRDSSTHVAKCSVVWFAEKPARGASCLDVYTLKHRGRDGVPVQRIAYESAGNDEPIHLSLEDAPQPEVQGEVERAEKLLADYIRQRASAGARRAEIMAFAGAQGIKERTTKRALASLIALGVLTQKTPDGKSHRGHYWVVGPRVGQLAEGDADDA